MVKTLSIYISLILPLIGITTLFAQENPTESAIQSTSKNLGAVYNKTINKQSRVYNGKEYFSHNPNIQGLPYFQDATFFTNGTVKYDGFLYENVPLMYDLNRDLLVSLYHDGYSKYSLISDKISDFQLLNHQFVYIKTDSTALKSPLASGIYDQIYKGKIEVLVKRSRYLKESSGLRDLTRYFVVKNNFFLKKDGIYYSISNQRAFLNVLKDQKRQLQKFVKENKIKFSKDPDRALVMLANYYDHL